MSQEKSGASKNGGGYDLRHPGLIMKDGEREVHEFIGMWPLKPDADLVELTNTLAFSEFWDPPTLSFSKATTLLGLIRAARWFVGTSTEFGPTLYFISQFDSSLENRWRRRWLIGNCRARCSRRYWNRSDLRSECRLRRYHLCRVYFECGCIEK